MNAKNALAAAGALDVLDTYRALTESEQERVYGFAHDALIRQENPDEARAYDALEGFWCFVLAYRTREAREFTCHTLSLTENQYDRYVRAWEAIQAVQEEVEALGIETR